MTRRLFFSSVAALAFIAPACGPGETTSPADGATDLSEPPIESVSQEPEPVAESTSEPDYSVVETDCSRSNRNDGTDFWNFSIDLRNDSSETVNFDLLVQVEDSKLPASSGGYWEEERRAEDIAPGGTAELSASGPRDADQRGPVECLYEVKVTRS